jgi:NADPH2:quinone reductase
MMQAVLQSAPGGVDALLIGETDRPIVGPGQVLVRVHAAGVNRADIVQREGRYPPPPGASPLLGLEVAGVVADVGADVTGFAVGDAVFGLVAGGGYAEYALLDAACAIAKPDWLNFEQAATLPEAWMTAWLNLVDIAQLKGGETALIHAGASSVGITAIQLARLRGAKAIATAGSAEKVGFCEALGATPGIDYKTQDFAAVVNAQGGVDVILDCIGGAYLERNVASLKADGRLVTIGLMGGASAQLDLGRLLVKRLTVRGSTLRPQPLAVKARLTQAIREQILPALQQGRVQLTLDTVFDWHQVADAHRYIEASKNQGKVVLRMIEAKA